MPDPPADVASILAAALAAVDPAAAVRRALLDGPVPGDGPVRLLAVGKAACGMAEGARAELGDRLVEGLVTTVAGSARDIPGLQVGIADHPRPGPRGLRAASAALDLAARSGEEDTLLVLLSGGGSALWAAPPDGVELDALADVTGALLRAGAPIGELNVVRRHLSRIAGGRLARAAHPARLRTLAVSDVVGDDPATIASGPTVGDSSTYAEALAVVRRSSAQVPASVLRHLEAGAAGQGDETPFPDDPVVRTAEFEVVARGRDALRAAAAEAAALGYSPLVLTDHLVGEAREIGRALAGLGLGCREAGLPLDPPSALLLGGETTVSVRGNGTGGRNQELALAAAMELERSSGIVVASIGTDGVDGSTGAAGAIVDGETAARGRQAGLDPRDHLDRNDSHPFLKAANALWRTGPTGTNVNDILVILVGRPRP